MSRPLGVCPQILMNALRRIAPSCVWLICALGISVAQAEVHDDFLPVEKAFQLTPRIDNQTLILQWQIAPGYYLYQERFKLERGDEILTPTFAPAHLKHDPYLDKDAYIYEENARLTLPLSSKTAATEAAPFGLRVVAQGCAFAGLCYPPQSRYFRVDPASQTITPVTADEAAALNPVHAKTLAGASEVLTTEPPKAWLLQALLFAVLGGIILNLMPCVFPVLSIKVISLAQADREHLAQHGWVYTLGIVLCFLGFAAVLLIARAGGEAIGWGFQLQSPYLVTALAYLFFVMGLSLSGMLNIGTRWMGAGQTLTQRSGLSGSFFTGVLAAVVASPCTAPFMGVALGFALTQPGFVSLAVFAALGFGMALPMLLLCYMPKLVDKLPRPGTWMETLKELLAFPLYLTSLWLLWVLGKQAGLNTLLAAAVGGLLIVFGVWLFNRPSTGLAEGLRRVTMIGAWALALLLPLQLLATKTDESLWHSYSPKALAEAREQGKPVLINLTADWCITCLANERVALGTEEVENLLKTKNITTLKGDWTNRDPEITKLLSEYGRSGVPLYLWIPAGHKGKAIVLPQLLSKSLLVETLSGDIESGEVETLSGEDVAPPGLTAIPKG